MSQTSQVHPAFSTIGPNVSVYLRADLLAGIRNRLQTDPAVIKRIAAVKQGTRFAQNDPDIPMGIAISPAQTWNAALKRWEFEWQWIPQVERILAANKTLWLRPFAAVAAGWYCGSSNLKAVTGGGKTTIDLRDEVTTEYLEAYYDAFNEKIVKPYRSHINGVEMSLSASLDGGQVSTVAHLGGESLEEVFDTPREAIIAELALQRRLFGLASIGHISPASSEKWLNVWFAGADIRAAKEDSRPFRETNDCERAKQEAGWETILDIGETTAGTISDWTDPNGKWYAELKRFYGDDYPGNVQRAFARARELQIVVWPMNDFPTRESEPEYFTHYLESGDGHVGGFAYAPERIANFVRMWRAEDPQPIPEPGDNVSRDEYTDSMLKIAARFVAIEKRLESHKHEPGSTIQQP